MQLTVIGSGNIVPQANRRAPAYLLQQDSHNVLLDMGPGTLHQLAVMGLAPSDIGVVLFSHLHLDHAIDALQLLAHRAIGEKHERHPGLRLVGPPGFRKELEGWVNGLNPQILEENDDLVWDEVGNDSIEVGPWTVHAVPVNHRIGAASGAVGYHMESTSGVLSYTGDSALCEGLSRLLDHRGCLLCECTSPDTDPWMGHLTPSQIRRLAERNPPNLLLLTHVGPGFKKDDLPGTPFSGYPGRVDVAQDGMLINFDSNYIHTFVSPPE